jgi:FkbM family methyltransferase
MTSKKFKKTMEFKSATVGILSFFEKIIRSHPLIYVFIRSIVRFTNIFEKDFDGLKLLKFKEKINIIDVGASDGVAAKYFNNNLDTGTIFCFEPNPYYYKLLRKINFLNVIVKPYAIGTNNTFRYAYHPRYKFLNKNYDIISYSCYGRKHAENYIADFKFKKNLSMIREKIYMKKVGKIQKNIGLIKVDTNGNELFVIKALQKIIKKNKPAIIVEINNDILSIDKILKKYSYKGYYYSIEKKKFFEKGKKLAVNKYYLQKEHLYN